MWFFVSFLIGIAVGIGALILLYWQKTKLLLKQQHELKSRDKQLDGIHKDLQSQRSKLKQELSEFDSRKIQYNQLVGENNELKQDLLNTQLCSKKLRLDQEELDRRQVGIQEQSEDLAGMYLKENVKWLGTRLSPNNFASSKQQLIKVIECCRSIGFDIPKSKEKGLQQYLKVEYEETLKRVFEREEQARIKAQIREEKKREQEIEREQQRIDNEMAAIQAALGKALKSAKGEHDQEIEHLRAKLAEAEEKSKRNKSQAEMTKSGHVYVISNIGSFGDKVFKIGMTRRLEPLDRVKELGDASVPFPFDVHMMISCDDAPSLENTMHKALHDKRLNKVNLRREFFQTNIEAIRKLVEKHHGEVEYVASPKALQYFESQNMTKEDFEYVEESFSKLEKEIGGHGITAEA